MEIILLQLFAEINFAAAFVMAYGSTRKCSPRDQAQRTSTLWLLFQIIEAWTCLKQIQPELLGLLGIVVIYYSK